MKPTKSMKKMITERISVIRVNNEARIQHILDHLDEYDMHEIVTVCSFLEPKEINRFIRRLETDRRPVTAQALRHMKKRRAIEVLERSVQK